MQSLHIPESHRDLFEGRSYAALTTLMPDGHPQTTPVWCNLESGCILINTMQGFRKEKNMRLNPTVTLLVYDPAHPSHCVEIRGVVVDMTEDGAIQHLDTLTQLYMNNPDARFFGDSVPLELQATYRPIKVIIQPTRVRTEE